MSCYFIAFIDIHDEDGYGEYLAGFDEVFEHYRGRVLAVEDEPRMLEGAWPAGRTVVIEFPDEAELRRWYESPEYQRLAARRRQAADASIAIVSGFD
ncbi:MAG TPA: DUF1330 domain-containing protein [Candidatus Sulfomarinibacteraceae bacterium]|nr:DUF1330 domain-containing protein [Candidatus Sulfomarinibacteraceae bacterium]